MRFPFTRVVGFWQARAAWVDLAVLTAGLVAVNCFLDPARPGWRTVSPCPYLLLPVLMGSRYGFGMGLVSGFLGGGLVLAGGRFTGVLGEVSTQPGYLLIGFVVLGGLCGSVQSGFRKREDRVTRRNEVLEDRLKRLDGDLFLLREAKSELERLLATRDSEFSTLDGEVRRLFDSEGDDLYQNVLLVLNRQARATDAGLYRLESGDRLVRMAVVGSRDRLPESMSVNEVEMVGLAVRNRTPVTIPEFWQQAKSVHRDYLLVVPILDTAEEVLGVLVVTGMPFINLTRKTVHVVSLICRWAARVIELRSRSAGKYRVVGGVEGQKIFTPGFFRKNLELAFDSFREQGQASCVVLFTAPGRPMTDQEALERLIMGTVRGGDLPVSLDLPVPHLAVLLPLSNERGAGIFVNRANLAARKVPPFDQALESKVFTFEGYESVDSLWQALCGGPSHETRPDPS